ncbi:hypothetical protein JDN40_00375, partial [Rhodomicrobium vannielii ATCC 17100]|uniref:hypothetical protein n=1 Tax=Rhodomicrobium vannielii TaxID=1069 RepID=UPI00191A8699
LDLDRGETALIHFAIMNDWRNVLWLLKHGADYEKKNASDDTAVNWLQESYERSIKRPPETLEYRDKVRDWLLARGVDRSRIDPRPKAQRGGN